MATVAAVAAVVSHHYAYELVSSHGESGLTAQLLPFTMDCDTPGVVLADAGDRLSGMPCFDAFAELARLAGEICAVGGASPATVSGQGWRIIRGGVVDALVAPRLHRRMICGGVR